MDTVTKSVGVLLVDDQEAFRSAARLVVELTDGFEIVGEASTGEEGVELVDTLRPDLVLMDVKMPGIDGLEATRRILAKHPEARVIVLSTYEEYASRTREAGALAFISKADFGPGVLSEVWSSAV